MENYVGRICRVHSIGSNVSALEVILMNSRILAISHRGNFKLVFLILLMFFLIQPSDVMAEDGGCWVLTDILSGDTKDHQDNCKEEKNQASEGSASYFCRFFKDRCNNRTEQTYSVTATWSRPPSELVPGETVHLSADVVREANTQGFFLSFGISISKNSPTCNCGIVCPGNENFGSASVASHDTPATNRVDAAFEVPAGSQGDTFALRYCPSHQPGWRYVYEWVSDPNQRSKIPPREGSPPKDPHTELPPGGEAGGVITGTVAGPGSCVWHSYTNDQRAFVAQPGNVFPLPEVEPGDYMILVGPSGPDGLDMPPPWFNTYGPYALGAHSKWMAIMGAMSMLDIFRENAAVLLPYSDPGPVAVIYARNRDIMKWNAICVVPAAAVNKFFNNGNGYGVYSGPEEPTVFTIHHPYLITEIVNYHYNSGNGAEPGEIALMDEQGEIYGPWQASNTGDPDPRRYWTVKPMIVLKPGTYTVLDSDTSTWACNSESEHRGMSWVSGIIQDS